MKEESGDEDRRARETGARQRTFACFWVSLYILLPTYTCRRVSRRCSGLNILVAQSSLAPSPSPCLVSSDSCSFFSYVSSPRWPTNKRVILSSPAPVIHPRLELEILSRFRTVGFRDEKYRAQACVCFRQFMNLWIATSSVLLIAVYFKPCQF